MKAMTIDEAIDEDFEADWMRQIGRLAGAALVAGAAPERLKPNELSELFASLTSIEQQWERMRGPDSVLAFVNKTPLGFFRFRRAVIRFSDAVAAGKDLGIEQQRLSRSAVRFQAWAQRKRAAITKRMGIVEDAAPSNSDNRRKGGN